MQFKARRLQPGWFRRCLHNSVRLSLRAPFWWCLVYLTPVALGTQWNSLPGTMLLSAAVLLAGTVLAFKTDRLADESVWRLSCRLFSVSSVFVFPVLAIWLVCWLAAVGFVHTEASLLRASGSDFSAFTFQLGLLYLGLGLQLQSQLLLFVRVLCIVYAALRGHEPVRLPWVGLFNLHLALDQGITLLDDKKLGETAHDLNFQLTLWPLAALWLTVTLFPPLLGIFVPFVYCLYKETFWGEGLTDVQKKTVPLVSVNQT